MTFDAFDANIRDGNLAAWNAETGEMVWQTPDASKHSLDKLLPLLNARRVNFIEVPSAAELGAVAGRDSTAAVGVVDPQLANGIVVLTRTGSSGASGEGV